MVIKLLNAVRTTPVPATIPLQRPQGPPGTNGVSVRADGGYGAPFPELWISPVN